MISSVSDEPVVFEVDSQASDRALRAFLEWAHSSDATRVLYTPDVLVAVDSALCRGFFLEEVYFTTIWADRGSRSLRDALSARLDEVEYRPASDERDPDALIRLAIERGSPPVR